ncbi:MAG: lysophospholipid acyltransferase family protein [Bacteroidales bacterium]|nr:lysophospholipid acyltransferase family protein [Bacteroidales bacterium]
MKNQLSKIRFYLLFSFLAGFAFLPFKALYLLSDLWFLIIYYLIGYRKKVVHENLRFAFPDTSEEERKSIARKFYVHFCDSVFESIKTLHITKKEIDRRFKYKNIEIFDKIYNEDKSAILVSAHQGNWEWMIGIEPKIKHNFLAIYKPLKDEVFDDLLKNLRTKFANGSQMVAMNDIFRMLVSEKQQNRKNVSWFLVDQTPPKNYPFWTTFMNRETPFYNGPAKIAMKFNQPIVFMEITKLKRGFYEAEFSMLVEYPTQCSEEEIVEKYVKRIEAGIRKKPEHWLWSHRRWKHKKEK